MSSTSSTSSSSSNSFSTTPLGSVDGLVSGLNTSQLIQSLMQIERQPENAIIARRDALNKRIDAWNTLKDDIDAITTAMQDLRNPTNWKTAKATSSDTDIATVSANNGASQGSLTFSVKQLAQANIKSSAGSVASTSTVVASGHMLVAQGGSIGLGTITGSGSLSLGAHTFEVTTASAGAAKSGTTLGDSITVASGDTITVNISGTPQTLTLTAGTYTRRALADMITDASGGTINATVSGTKGLTLTTTREGSAATLQITGGVNLANLGLTAGAASNGTDGVIKVDGVSNTVSDVNPASTTPITLNGASSDTVNATFVSGLRVGTVTAKNIDTGDGTLTSVVNAINAGATGVIATAVQVASNQYKLQLTSNAQGVAGSISFDPTVFSGLGDIDDLVTGRDADLVVGVGANEYTLKSSSNSVTNILPNVTVSLQATTDTPITITVQQDPSALGSKVSSIVDSINKSLTYIKQQSAYNTTTHTAGTMLGDFSFQAIEDGLISAVNSVVSESSLGSTSSVGITLQADGTFKFDQTAFSTAYQQNPEAVAQLFLEGGTTGTGRDGSSPGVVDRLVTFAARATDTGTGILFNSIQGAQTQIRDYETQIDNWEVRLAQRETTLRNQYSQMEVLLGQLKNTQGQIGGQLNRLAGG
jgi:flagellar hook-associated protein 2